MAVLGGLIGVTLGAAALTAAPARAVTGPRTDNLSLTTASGGSFWTRKARPVATTTTLTAAPDPAAAGATVTLTATVRAADGTVPRGEVAFLAGFTLISVAAVSSSGAATATTTFAASGPDPRTVSLAAWFFGQIGSYAGSAGRCSEIVNPRAAQGGGNTVPITVTVPRHGAFTVTITPGAVILSAPNRVAAQGTLLDITVTDLRTSHPGWSVSGQESNFTGSGVAAGHTISGNQLGWTPYLVSGHRRGWLPYLVPGHRRGWPPYLVPGHRRGWTPYLVPWPHGGVTPGPPVAPADPGLGTTAAILASAEEGGGFGTYVLSASVVLDIPPATAGGPYAGRLTITAVEAAP